MPAGIYLLQKRAAGAKVVTATSVKLLNDMQIKSISRGVGNMKLNIPRTPKDLRHD